VQPSLSSQIGFDLFFGSSSLAMLLVDAAGTIIEANRTLECLLGYASGELTGVPLAAVTHPDDLPQANQFIHQLAQASSSKPASDQTSFFHHDQRCLRKDGSLVFTHFNVSFIGDPSVSAVCTLCILEDISTRREDELRYRAVVEDQTELICRFLPDTTLTFVNPAYCRYFSQSASDLVGKPFLPMVAEADRHLVQETLATLSPQNLSYTYQHRVITPEGTQRWVQWTNRLILDENGQPFEYQSVGSDITLSKQAHDLLQSQWDLASALNARISLSEAFERILATLVSFEEISGAAIYLVDRSENCLHLAGHKGLPDAFIKHFQHLSLDHPSSHLFTQAQPSFTLMPDPSLRSLHTSALGEGLRAFIVIPVVHEGRVIAALNLVSHTLEDFPLHIQNALKAVAAQTAQVMARIESEEAQQVNQRNLSALFESLDDLILILDQSYRILSFNPVVASRLGLANAELYHRSFITLHPESARSQAAEALGRMAVGLQHSCTIPLQSSDNTLIHVETLLSPGWWDQQEVFFVACRDINQRMQYEQALQAANDQLTRSIAELESRHAEAVLLNKMGDMLQGCLGVDEIYQILSQYAPLLFPGQPGALYILDSTAQAAESVCTWGEVVRSLPAFSADQCWALRRSRRIIIADVNAQPTCTHFTELPPAYLCVPLSTSEQTLGLFYLESTPELIDPYTHLAATVSERIALALANMHLSEELRLQAIRDPLTDLYNRRYLEETLDREIRRGLRKNRTVSVMMIDIDNFKRYNTLFYLEGGDTMLKALGSFLKKNIRQDDVACRFGGDEFVLILPEATAAETYTRAEFIRQEVKKLSVYLNDQPLGEITLSIGVAAFPEHAADAASLLHAANVAAFTAKDRGCDQVLLAPPPSG
jgi:diguanylate cyclase (GGDEF)-like protein/PAS domain S-box-containing protein